MKNGNVMRHGEFNKYHSSFVISDSSHKPSKIFPTNKQNFEKTKNDSEILTSLHFQCDTSFQHTLKFTFHIFNKKPYNIFLEHKITTSTCKNITFTYTISK